MKQEIKDHPEYSMLVAYAPDRIGASYCARCLPDSVSLWQAGDH